MLLFSGGSEEKSAAEQAGGGDMLTVRRRSQCGWYDDTNQILLCSLLLQILEGYYMHLLRCHAQVLQMSTISIVRFCVSSIPSLLLSSFLSTFLHYICSFLLVWLCISYIINIFGFLGLVNWFPLVYGVVVWVSPVWFLFSCESQKVKCVYLLYQAIN